MPGLMVVDEEAVTHPDTPPEVAKKEPEKIVLSDKLSQYPSQQSYDTPWLDYQIQRHVSFSDTKSLWFQKSFSSLEVNLLGT